MTDADTARRERAEEWANERGPRGKRRSSERALWKEAVMSYMAGEQDEAARAAAKLRAVAAETRTTFGEKEAVEGIVRWLRKVNYDFTAKAIERGEWKEGE